MTPQSQHKFLLDENIDIRLVKFLTDLGYQVVYCPKGAKNGQVISLSRKESAPLISLDKDFANPDLYSLTDSPGIIVLRIHPPTLEYLTAALTKLLSTYKFDQIFNKLFIVSPDNVEIITR
ncbi:MAG: DUF5615 family PIN-like protein [Patescibacteria group bacterium]